VTTSGPVSGPADHGPVRQLGQRGLHAALRAGGATGGHHARRGIDQAVLDQGAGGIRQVLRRGVQDQRPGGGGQRGPVDVTAHIGHGVRRTQRQPGIGGHRRRRRQTGDDLEHRLRLGHGGDLGEHRVHRQGVAGDQPDHVGAQPGLMRQRLGHLGRVTERGPDVGTLRNGGNGWCGGAVLAGRRGGRGTRRRRQLRTHQRQDRLRHVGVGEDQRGVGQYRSRPRRQQTGVTRSGTDEHDAPRLRLAPSSHLVLLALQGSS
jgi:hypothetical protein